MRFFWRALLLLLCLYWRRWRQFLGSVIKNRSLKKVQSLGRQGVESMRSGASEYPLTPPPPPPPPPPSPKYATDLNHIGTAPIHLATSFNLFLAVSKREKIIY